MKPLSIGVLLGLSLLMIPAPRAAAIDVVISGSPTLIGNGPGLQARFHDVATVDGTSVDLFGKILSQSTNKTNDFRTVGDDFQFTLMDGEDGENRWATVRWTFYEAGTYTPVAVEDLVLTIDDLDDYWSRTESFETGDAVSYIVNDPTTVFHSFTGGTLTATGGGRHNTGDPESAVRMNIESGSSFVVTYRTDFYTDADAGFVHDGDGDFVFSNPEVRLFYTYHFTNNEAEPVTIDFSDGLPAGLIWDTEFTPQVDGPLSGGAPVFNGGHSTVSINGLILGPGNCSLTLGTLQTTVTGTIENSATIIPTDPSGPSQGASASITLP